MMKSALDIHDLLKHVGLKYALPYIHIIDLCFLLLQKSDKSCPDAINMSCLVHKQCFALLLIALGR